MKVAFSYYPLAVNFNHGAALLSGECLKNGIETEIIPFSETYKKEIIEFNPDFVCVSFVTIHDYEMSVQFIEKLKIPLIAGGVYLRKGGKVDNSLFYRICRGEAENISDFFLNGDESVFDSPQRCKNISQHSDIDLRKVTGFEFDRGFPVLKGKKIIPYSSSRGCPFRCAFCESKNLKQGIRIKNTVSEDIGKIVETHNPDLVYIMDELLPYYNYDWLKQISQININFMGYIRADIDDGVLQFLIDKGLKFCAFGIESGDEEYRNNVLLKDLLDSDIKRTISILKKNNIDFISFFMTGSPGETMSIKEKTYKMASMIGNSVIWNYENLEVQ